MDMETNINAEGAGACIGLYNVINTVTVFRVSTFFLHRGSEFHRKILFFTCSIVKN